MKEYIVEISKYHNIFDLIQQPIRTKEQADILLLETVRTFIIGNIEQVTNVGKVILHIDKMSRFIYCIENKMVAINCPFTCSQKEGTLVFKDKNSNIRIDSKLISNLISIIKKQREYSFEKLLEEVMNIEEYEEMKESWEILKKLNNVEYGYLRYDYDEEHSNGKIHPLNHIDVNYTPSNQFKIGLSKKISVNEFIDILDLTTDCYYLHMY